MHSVCVVELHATLNYIKILSVVNNISFMANLYRREKSVLRKSSCTLSNAALKKNFCSWSYSYNFAEQILMTDSHSVVSQLGKCCSKPF